MEYQKGSEVMGFSDLSGNELECVVNNDLIYTDTCLVKYHQGSLGEWSIRGQWI
jgi:hypothetical protein